MGKAIIQQNRPGQTSSSRKARDVSAIKVSSSKGEEGTAALTIHCVLVEDFENGKRGFGDGIEVMPGQLGWLCRGQ